MRFCGLTTLTLLLSCAAGFELGGTVGWATQTQQIVTIIYSNDVLGELEPCGCRNNPLGGLSRKAILLDQLKETPILQLDAGDLLFETSSIPPALAKQSELQASYLLRGLDLLKHDAAVPGEKDLALGVATFEKLIKKSQIQFLAANLTLKNGKSFLKPYIFLNRGGLRIAVIGLVGPELNWPSELKAGSVIPAAQKAVRDVQKNADLVIALTHQGYEADLSLAKAVQGFDVIIGAHSQAFLQAPTQINSTRIYQSSFRNQYIGVLPARKPFTGEGHRLVALDSSLDSTSALTQLVQESKSAIAQLNDQEAKDSALLSKELGSNTPRFQTFPRCAECHLKQFNFWRKTPHAHAFQALSKDNQTQNKACLACHSLGLGKKDGYEIVDRLAEQEITGQKAKPIAQKDLVALLETIQKNDASSSTVSQLLSQTSRSWVPVQCENCHTPGQNHPFSGTYSKQVQTTVCLNCHTAQRAPKWYTQPGQPDSETISKKRISVSCPAGELSEPEN